MSILAVRVRELRKKRCMSQEELAHEVGTSQRQISKYETGENDPTAHVLDSLATALGTTADYLLGRTDVLEIPVFNYDELSKGEKAIIRALRQREPMEAIRLITEDGSEFKVTIHQSLNSKNSQHGLE